MKIISCAILLVGLVLGQAHAESYSRWTKEDMIRLGMQFITDTKEEFARRALAVKNETGEVVELDYQYYHDRTPEQEKSHQSFLKGRVSQSKTEAHLANFAKDLERVRQKLAEAEATAFESWNARDDRPAPAPEAEAQEKEVFGVDIHARKLGLVLDNSPSMERYLEKVRGEIGEAFPDYRLIEIWGSFLRSDHGEAAYAHVQPRPDHNPFDPRFFCPKIPTKDLHWHVTRNERDNLSAIRALAELEGVDAVYWFCDLKDDIDDKAVEALAEILKKHKAKLIVHTLGRTPPRRLSQIAEASGGGVNRKRVR